MIYVYITVNDHYFRTNMYFVISLVVIQHVAIKIIVISTSVNKYM